jgi:hypothetical protein
MPLEAYSPGTVTVELGSDPVTTLVVELGTPGPQGQQGEPGQNGTNGQNGVGVPVGGSAGQVLAKINGTNYNTEWADVVNPEYGFSLNTGAVIDANSGTVNLGAVNINGTFAMEASGYLYLSDGSKSVIILPYNGIILAGGANLKFSDDSTQTTAFIDAPSDGNKYARKNGTWEQFNGGVWGQITGTLSNQTDLYNALSAKYDASNPSGYITVSALAPYLLSSTAASTYLTQANASSTYLTQSNASSTYLTLSSASATYFPKPTGTSDQYIDGSGALQTFPTVTAAGKMVTSVRNNTGATLTKGTVVYINGAVGNKPTVAKAQANTEVTSKATFAFVEANIANNADGNVVQIGLLENINTQGFDDGTLIYLSPTVAGGWTSTQPFSPNHYTALGTVIRGNHPNLGSIQVRINNGFQLDEMSDVGAVSPTNNNILTWNAATSQWLDKSISTILGYTPANDSLVLNKASNLSDLQSASTARTNLGLDYATDAQVIAGTSTSVVLNPSNAQQLLDVNNYGSYQLTTFNWTTVTAGTGGSTYQAFPPNKEVSVTTAIGSALFYANLYVGSRGRNVSQGPDWSKKNSFSIRVGRNNTPETNTIFRCFLSQKSMVTKDLDARGIGFTINGAGSIVIQVHNGSARNTATTSFASVNSFIDVKIESDGAGTTTCFVNGTSVGTCTGSPTTNGSVGLFFNIELQNTDVQPASQIYYTSFAKIDIA